MALKLKHKIANMQSAIKGSEMKHDFWHERWDEGQIAFHQPQANEMLKALWAQLNAPGNARVFVPLCGKSLDMIWLHEQGSDVVGVELSQLAVDAFFVENELTRTSTQRGPFQSSSTPGIELLCGDFFALTEDLIGTIDVVYDRGALVALPADMRPGYAAHLAQLLPPSATILLLVVEYDQSEMDGPPFAITSQMVTDYYASGFSIEQVAHEPIEDLPERFLERGLTAMTNAAYVLKRNAK